MINGSDVSDIEIFERSCLDINAIFSEILSACNESRSKAILVLEETQKEMAVSNSLLVAAIEEEARCLTVMTECQVEVNAASAGLPYTAAWYAEACARLTAATIEYEKAVAHRVRMEERVRLVTQSVQMAVEMLESLNMRINYCTSEIQLAGNTGISRMSEAFGILTGYSLLQMPIETNVTSFADNASDKEHSLDKQYIPNSYVTINGERYRTDDNGNIYSKRDSSTGEYANLPNSKYVLNGYNYTTDSKGRINGVSGSLQAKNHEGRPTINDAVAGMKDNDEKGHLIADRFNGSIKNGNLVAMDKNLNHGKWNEMEETWAKYVEAGRKVDVDIKVVYDDSNRPTKFIVKYTVDGEKQKRVYPNG